MKKAFLYSLIILLSSCSVCFECSRQKICADCTRSSTNQINKICSDEYIRYKDYLESKKSYEEKGFECLEKSGGIETKILKGKGLISRINIISDKEDIEDNEGFICTKKLRNSCK